MVERTEEKSVRISIRETDGRCREVGFKYNPFIPAPLGESNMSLFVGREKEIDRAILAMGNRKNIMISGWKGMGKTSILNYIKATAKSEKILVGYLPFPPTEERPFFLEILSSLLRENMAHTDDQRIYVIREHINRYYKSPAAYPTNLIIQEIMEAIDCYSQGNEDFPFVVFIDEAQKMAEQKTRNSLQVTLCDLMFKPNFLFVCAGMTSFFKLSEQPDFAIGDRFHPEGDIILSPFNNNDVKDLIDKRLRLAAINYPDNFVNPFVPGVVARVYEYSEGNPREVISLCGLLFEHYISSGRITEETVEECAAKLNILFTQRVLVQFSEETQKVYKVIDNLKRGSPKSIGMVLGKSPPTIQYHLNILKQAGLVVSKGKAPATTYYVAKDA
jgi:Cdc6-like AAA superfamily ATPase